MRAGALALALLAVLPALAATLYFLAGDVRALTDPAWSSSQSRASYVAMMIAVKGALFAAIGVSAYGIIAASRRIGFIGAGCLVLAALPLVFGAGGIFVFLSALMVGAVSWRPPRAA